MDMTAHLWQHDLVPVMKSSYDVTAWQPKASHLQAPHCKTQLQKMLWPTCQLLADMCTAYADSTRAGFTDRFCSHRASKRSWSLFCRLDTKTFRYRFLASASSSWTSTKMLALLLSIGDLPLLTVVVCSDAFTYVTSVASLSVSQPSAFTNSIRFISATSATNCL